MATVRKTITLTDQQDDWIKAQVEADNYTTTASTSAISYDGSKSATLKPRLFEQP